MRAMLHDTMGLQDRVRRLRQTLAYANDWHAVRGALDETLGIIDLDLDRAQYETEKIDKLRYRIDRLEEALAGNEEA